MDTQFSNENQTELKKKNLSSLALWLSGAVREDQSTSASFYNLNCFPTIGFTSINDCLQGSADSAEQHTHSTHAVQNKEPSTQQRHISSHIRYSKYSEYYVEKR